MEKKLVDSLARIGLTAKGCVYSLVGVLAFMAAFELAGTSDSSANQKGAFQLVKNSSGGSVLLSALTLGLVAYCIWRFIQAFSAQHKVVKKARYFFSGLAYAALAFTAMKLLFNSGSSGSQKQEYLAEFLSKPKGEWLVGVIALILVAIGVYQVYYGLSEKYKKHVQQMNEKTQGSKLLLLSGKIGYPARGIVWLLLSFLLFKAVIESDKHGATDTGGVFTFVENGPFGSYMLAAIGIGLVAYGIFNFIRAKYETMK